MTIISKKKRVLMIAPDVIIDRRILIEGETLVDEGYEVFLLAGWDSSQDKIFEIVNGVHIERIRFEGIDDRLIWLYKFQSKAITFLNKTANLTNKIWGRISTFTYNLISKSQNQFAKFFNFFLKQGERVFGKMGAITSKHCRISKLIGLCLLIHNKFIVGLAKFTNKTHSLLILLQQKIINFCVKINNHCITLVARSTNYIVLLIVKATPKILNFTAYENGYYKRAIFYRPDIIHVHDLPMLKIGCKIKNKLNIPLIYDMHEFYPEQPRLSFKDQKSLRTLEAKYIKKVDYAITVNFMLGQVIKERYNLNEIYIVQNSITMSGEYNSEKKYDRFREDYPNLNNKLLLLYQGWIAKERNLENIIQGMKLVKDNKWVLLIMGYGDYSEELAKLVEEIGGQEKVQFVPSKDQDILLTYTSSADLGLIPYPKNRDLNTHYVSPNKLYEFIMAGLPIVTNELPYVKYVVEQNNFGIVADMESAEGFAEAIDKIDIDKLEIFKVNIRNNAWKFSWENEKKNLLSIYEEL